MIFRPANTGETIMDDLPWEIYIIPGRERWRPNIFILSGTFIA